MWMEEVVGNLNGGLNWQTFGRFLPSSLWPSVPPVAGEDRPDSAAPVSPWYATEFSTCPSFTLADLGLAVMTSRPSGSQLLALPLLWALRIRRGAFWLTFFPSGRFGWPPLSPHDLPVWPVTSGDLETSPKRLEMSSNPSQVGGLYLTGNLDTRTPLFSFSKLPFWRQIRITFAS